MTAVLIDTTFFQTAEALARYMKSLGLVECKTLCGMVRLSTAGVIATLRNRLIRAVERNLGLMQLATVSGVELTYHLHDTKCPGYCVRLLACSRVVQTDWLCHLVQQVSYCWNDISSILAANLQTPQHPDLSILEQLEVSIRLHRPQTAHVQLGIRSLQLIERHDATCCVYW